MSAILERGDSAKAIERDLTHPDLVSPRRSTFNPWIRLSDPALVADLRDFFRAWGCISTETSGDTIKVLLAGAPTEPQAELQIRTCLGAWLSTHPGVEAEIIA